MINRILMEIYDDYSAGNMDSLLEFTKKTFPSDGTDKLFVGCVLILFSTCGAFKGRYYATGTSLLSIVKTAKEEYKGENLLAFYVERINTTKGISKYLNDIIKDDNIGKYADVIIDYLDWFTKPRFSEDIKKVIDSKEE